MSLHTRCPQRIASTCAHRTVWRRRCVRYFASDAANDPEWFQGVRTELLSRKPHYHREDLDLLHHEQLYTTLVGFAPRHTKDDADSRSNISLAELLTRFNIRIQSSALLSDGTDPLHSPGEPWMRRMWAGGAVKLSPDLRLRFETPFKLQQRVACLERIKDVRLQGTGDESKIFVTVERRFASRDADPSQSEGNVRANNFKRAIRDSDWSDSLVKEERNLVFMKAKAPAELVSIKAGQTLGPRYLKSPGEPDFLHTLTPTRSLLFRYSAVTYNAHLLHLDSAYARYVEGHRNLLVHGPLTLTLMLQVLNKHLRLAQIGQGYEAIESIEYRNLAPLYCDEEMRVCIKNKKRTDTGNSWDIWIEGPTGGMAVKAVAQTINRSAHVVPTDRAAKGTASADLPDVQTVALQAQDRLNALRQEDSGKEQLSQVSREERRKLWRQEQRNEPDQGPTGTPRPSQERAAFSRRWRSDWVGKHLRYLYLDLNSPLLNNAEVPRLPSSQSTRRFPRPQEELKSLSRKVVPYSNIWRKQRIGKSLPYLYLGNMSPLINRTVVPRPSPQTNTAPAPIPASSTSQSSTIPTALESTASDPPSTLPSLRERQRAMLRASMPTETPSPTNPGSNSDAARPLPIRTVETDGPVNILSLESTQTATEPRKLSSARKREQRPKPKLKPLKIRKMEQVSIRKVDIQLKEVERKRAHAKKAGVRKALKNDVLGVLRAADGGKDTTGTK